VIPPLRLKPWKNRSYPDMLMLNIFTCVVSSHCSWWFPKGFQREKPYHMVVDLNSFIRKRPFYERWNEWSSQLELLTRTLKLDHFSWYFC
jgi:hypothetical protein